MGLLPRIHTHLQLFSFCCRHWNVNISQFKNIGHGKCHHFESLKGLRGCWMGRWMKTAPVDKRKIVKASKKDPEPTVSACLLVKSFLNMMWRCFQLTRFYFCASTARKADPWARGRATAASGEREASLRSDEGIRAGPGTDRLPAAAILQVNEHQKLNMFTCPCHLPWCLSSEKEDKMLSDQSNPP